ncbi:hypothetical protein PRUPE_4G057700 [Prunus persica]|uniref:Uncharacterized protein n=1 Tax=Prunus persica TaxID=3760 RepID=A0A251PGB2_PRUPE|nr:hypothetical protein PRUPE_4G057700 [Prunus persica]
MAESKKAISSSVNPKEKSSLPDEEIGNEFLSSWKSMSVMEDDEMDFSFDTVSKGKKKVFDFEKLDMDFNLDGDFNKLSSFKMDMPDLDFSSPPKKAAKTKERSEEEPSRGNRQGKQDRFKFSFDFNELDNFDFDSSLKKSENSSNKNQESSKEVVSDRSGSQNSKIDPAEEISTLDGDSERVATSKVDTTLLVSGNGNSMNDDCASKSETSENLELPYGPTSPEQVMTKRVEESDQEIHLSEKAMPTEPYANQATHDLPHQLVGGVDSNGDTVFEGKNDDYSHITNVNTFSSGKEDVNEKMPIRDGPDHEDSHLKDSSPMNIAGSGSNNGGRSKSGSDILTENFEPAIDDSDLEDNSNSLVSKETPHNIKSMKEDQNSTGKLPLSMQGRHFHSNVSKRLEEAGSQLCQPSLKGAKSLSSGIKRIGIMHPHPAIEQGEDFNSAGVPNKAKLVGNSLLCNKEVTEREPVLGSGQRKSLNDLRHVEISSSQASPSSSSEKTSKPSTQTCVNSKFMLSSLESMRNTKIITAEGNKLFTDKPAKKKTELSTLNISKKIGGNKVSFNAASQKEVKSLSSEKHMEVQSNVELKTAQIVDRSEKQMPPNLSLKRKTFEGSDSGLASLKPLKRLSQSPSEIRNVTEPSKRVVEEQVYIHESHLETKTKSTLDDHPTSGLGSPCSNAMELEIHSIMENDGNVEKAEAYTKELEDICNMLKKKHEEAKELLVRAVVNNNNLLMLNHPIYDAKIHKVQKFAAKLVSKELQKCSRAPTVVI